MAYAEKVFKVKNGVKTKQFTWRCVYNGKRNFKSGFPTKKLAVDWGNEQERLIREGSWITPERQATTFGEFAPTYMTSRRKRGRTVGTRWDRLETHILPRWEDTRLRDITWFDVDTWQQSMDIADVSRGHCVSLMSTILTAAVDAQHITVNPLFGRRRTRDTSGDAAKPKAPKVSRDPRPEDALLLAERLGPARGIHVLTTAFTGLRWGEGLGLHRDRALLERRQPWGPPSSCARSCGLSRSTPSIRSAMATAQSAGTSSSWSRRRTMGQHATLTCPHSSLACSATTLTTGRTSARSVPRVGRRGAAATGRATFVLRAMDATTE